MNWTLEVVVVPVSDVDRAKAFYAEQLGFNVDHDTRAARASGWSSSPHRARAARSS
jgi:catechol 2,3-dioxygenase-like lactoylglutathione lyase family enzyme